MRIGGEHRTEVTEVTEEELKLGRSAFCEDRGL
jgi:hypothetical protein